MLLRRTRCLEALPAPGATRCSIRRAQQQQQQQQQQQLPRCGRPGGAPWPAARCAALGDGAAAPAAAAGADTASLAPPHGVPRAQPHNILRAVALDGSELFLEVLPDSSSSSGSDQLCQVAHQGVVYALAAAARPVSADDSGSSSEAQQPSLQLLPQAWVLQPDHPLVQSLPGWAAAVKQQQARQQLPREPVLLRSLAPGPVYSAAQLQAAVRQNAAPWRDGTGPNDPPLQGLAYQTLCAGEIEALLCRARGVAMVQLWAGWGPPAGAQPVHNCLVLHSLGRALQSSELSIFMSSAPGGLGLTAILAAKAEPFRAWAAHLASFGAQAALVADSPFYKLLIGRVLGYAEPNIRHHIQVTSGRAVAPEVAAAVDKELAALSRVPPHLPWAPASSASGGVGSSSSGGARQQRQPTPAATNQQLPRSARKKNKQK